jgi:hypothetical protein
MYVCIYKHTFLSYSIVRWKFQISMSWTHIKMTKLRAL